MNAAARAHLAASRGISKEAPAGKNPGASMYSEFLQKKSEEPEEKEPGERTQKNISKKQEKAIRG